MPQTTRSYHHGDLRVALVDAGLELARVGGVDAVGVREVTRQAGVSPASVYRHFDDHRALVVAVALAAQDRLAEAMVERIGTLVDEASALVDDAASLVDEIGSLLEEEGTSPDGATSSADALTSELAVARLRGVGLGYIDFALAEPGWFELALLTFDPRPGGGPAVMVDSEVPAPFLLLLDALDGCVAAGVLTPQQREHAEWPCWSAVHGFADIATRGPLVGQDPAALAALGRRVVEAIIAGLRA
ncbi:TetR/AcrR family transcriptional regulator [Demequina sp. NBRC 110056]|uniref:TetR/AcrR family transcriptional regulator n=1 Tax=Demequina sp. NBRC 110056 TaxID=1570345 RepID=UPI000A04C82F|nr:TetR/AcrR family transcriptional regulator [Demequina sp. NBRC 110056]